MKKEAYSGSPPEYASHIHVLWRRCATLPHSSGCSTIAVLGLSFRVRNGTGRLPQAMTAANLQFHPSPSGEGHGVFWWFGDRMVDACSVFDRLWPSVHIAAGRIRSRG